MVMQQQTTIVVKSQKSMGIAYALWFFLGQFGLHRFYLDKPVSGAIMAVLGGVGWLTLVLAVGVVALIPLWIWLIVDAFLIPGLVRRANQVNE